MRITLTNPDRARNLVWSWVRRGYTLEQAGDLAGHQMGLRAHHWTWQQLQQLVFLRHLTDVGRIGGETDR